MAPGGGGEAAQVPRPRAPHVRERTGHGPRRSWREAGGQGPVQGRQDTVGALGRVALLVPRGCGGVVLGAADRATRGV